MTQISKNSEPIAIIGYSCRFAGSSTPEEYWNILSTGKDATCPVPSVRHFASAIESNISRGGFLNCAVDEVDVDFFKIHPKEAPFLDPQQRLLLEVTWEALERSGINPQSLQGSKTAVFVGAWSNDYEKILHFTPEGRNSEFHVAYLSYAFGAIASRINYFLGLHGPHSTIDAGCASSLYSVAHACNALRDGTSDLAIAGGTHLILYPVCCRADSLVFAPDGRSKPFDAKADGYARGEGVATIILKRLSDAIRDKDLIQGIIRGIATNSDASSATYGTPCKNAQTKVLKCALDQSGLSPTEVDWIEAHATGKIMGDCIELASIKSVYANNVGREKPLWLTCVKSNIAHAEGAAGLAGIIKVLLSFKHETIPKQINFKSPHPSVDLNAIPADVPTQNVHWARHDGAPRYAAVNGFGLGGHGAHVILQEPPMPSLHHSSVQNGSGTNGNFEMRARLPHILCLSAKSLSALQTMKLQYTDYVKKKGHEFSLYNFCHTVNTARAQLPFRIAVTGKSDQELLNRLTETDIPERKCPSQPPKIAFVFTDHLSTKYFQVSKTLYDTSPQFKHAFDRCSGLWTHSTNILNLLIKLGNEEAPSLPVDDITFALPALFCIQFCLAQVWKEAFGIKPNFSLGYGTGQIVAAIMCDILTLEEGFEAISEISVWIQSQPATTYFALRADSLHVSNLITKFGSHESTIHITAVHSDVETIIGIIGDSTKPFLEFSLKQGVRAKRCSTSHSVYAKLSSFAHFPKIFEEKMLNFESLNCQFISTTTGKFLSSESDNGFRIEEIVTNPVNFAESMKTLSDTDCRIFIEISPHPVLIGLAMSTIARPIASSFVWASSVKGGEDDDPWMTLLSNLGKVYCGGINVNWALVDEPYAMQKMELPLTYPFQRKKYWIGKFDGN